MTTSFAIEAANTYCRTSSWALPSINAWTRAASVVKAANDNFRQSCGFKAPPAEKADDFDFEDTLCDIHDHLKSQHQSAALFKSLLTAP